MIIRNSSEYINEFSMSVWKCQVMSTDESHQAKCSKHAVRPRMGSTSYKGKGVWGF